MPAGRRRQSCSALFLLHGACEASGAGGREIERVDGGPQYWRSGRSIQEEAKSGQRKGPRVKERERDPWSSSVVFFQTVNVF